MTDREKFCAAMAKRGYKVENLGRMTFLRSNNYTAIWFFHDDGSRDLSKPAYWTLDAPRRSTSIKG